METWLEYPHGTHRKWNIFKFRIHFPASYASWSQSVALCFPHKLICKLKTQVTFDGMLLRFHKVLWLSLVSKKALRWIHQARFESSKQKSLSTKRWIMKTTQFWEGGSFSSSRLRPHLLRWAFPHLPIPQVLRQSQEPPAWREFTAEGLCNRSTECHASLPCFHQIMILIINIIMNIIHGIVLLLVLIIILILSTTNTTIFTITITIVKQILHQGVPLANRQMAIYPQAPLSCLSAGCLPRKTWPPAFAAPGLWHLHEAPTRLPAMKFKSGMGYQEHP